LAERLLNLGAGLLQARREEVVLEAGFVVSPRARIAIAEVARTWYRRPQDLPPDVDPGGLEVTAGYRPVRASRTLTHPAPPPLPMPRSSRWTRRGGVLRSSTMSSSRTGAFWSTR